MSDHRVCTQHEQAAQIAISLLGYAAMAFLAATAVPLWQQPNPGSELPVRLQLCGIGIGCECLLILKPVPTRSGQSARGQFLPSAALLVRAHPRHSYGPINVSEADISWKIRLAGRGYQPT